MSSVWRQLGRGRGGGSPEWAAINAKATLVLRGVKAPSLRVGYRAREGEKKKKVRRVNRVGGLKTLPPRSLFRFNLEVAGARPPACGPRGTEREAPVLVPGACRVPGARPSAPLPVAGASLNGGVVFVFDPRALAAWRAAEAGASGAGPGAAEAEEDGAGVREGPAAPWNWARSPPTAAACSSLAAPRLRRSPRGRCCSARRLLADCPLSPT